MLPLGEEPEQVRFCMKIQDEGLSVRATEQLVQDMIRHADAEPLSVISSDGTRRPRIRVWMRTLRYKRVVAFRTFLRTLLHEVCHHLDYTLLALDDSFHTQGFFNRESSLFKQLVPESLLSLDRPRSRP